MDWMLKRAQAGHATGGAVCAYRSVRIYSGQQDAQDRAIPDPMTRRPGACAVWIGCLCGVVAVSREIKNGMRFTDLGDERNGARPRPTRS